MREVTVTMLGQDGTEHCFTTQASSLFDAANKAIQKWAQFWWYDPTALLTVEDDDDCWRVRQDIAKRSRKGEPPSKR